MQLQRAAAEKLCAGSVAWLCFARGPIGAIDEAAAHHRKSRQTTQALKRLQESMIARGGPLRQISPAGRQGGNPWWESRRRMTMREAAYGFCKNAHR
ncbi:MAG: hypothetical protein U1E51_03670 [Candidatus Binatia bacterium]|nr:hypothetical protein [Candidatus Binatia bacterium]